jgi:hypothetical protein
MKIGSSLALVCVGAILAFAVTANTSVFSIHTAGWVLMLIGVIGLLLPRSTAGWLGRRLLVRRTYPGGQVEEIPVPPYVARNPGVAALEAGLPSRPSLLDDDGGDLIEEQEDPRYRQGTTRLSPGKPGRRGTSRATTEVVEDLNEQPY